MFLLHLSLIHIFSTEAIQKAIDSCAVSGGGTVILQPGYYQTGALFVKSGVNLQIGKGVTLLASPDIHHYPCLFIHI